MIKTLAVAARDRARLGEIAAVASRFGLETLLARIGIACGGDAGEDKTGDLPQRTRLAIEALGPTFVKLGQILGTRGDLLAPEWIAEFEKLHSQAPTLPFDALRPAVEEALGQPPEQAFARFDSIPLAAASMAQVHRAWLDDGRAVVLKIRRPGVRPRIEADLRIVAQLAALAEHASAEARRFSPRALARQLADSLRDELDFTIEGRNADRLREDFAGDRRVLVPDIHWAWSSETLLVMDFVEGLPPRDGETLRAHGIDPAQIAATGADMVLDMVLVNGRFHADPHPGNLLCLPGNRIAPLDLGSIGHVSPKRREEFLSFVTALQSGDPGGLADTLALWSDGHDVPRENVVRAAERLVARHGGGRIVLSALIGDFLPILRDERLVLPPDLLLIFRALLTIDGVLTGIQPDFDLSGPMARAGLRVAQARLAPERWQATAQALVWELLRLGDDAPRLIRAAVRRLEAPPVAEAAADDAAILAAGRWIAAALLAGLALVAGAILFGHG
ncbi:MAG TPA: AarF/UbiB family protein [Sphingomonas sp.]|nr:AarF/UbiB family protein [Sphingomonas sp.]